MIQHEVFHALTLSASSETLPLWFVEGFADVAGYRGVHRTDPPVSPLHLPSDQQMTGADAAQQYQRAYLFVTYLIRRFGSQRVLALYLAAVAQPGAEQVAARISTDQGHPLAALVVVWQAAAGQVARRSVT